MKFNNGWILTGCLLISSVDAAPLPKSVLHNVLQASRDNNLLQSELMVPLAGDGQRLYYGLLSGLIDDGDSRQLGLGFGVRQRMAAGIAGGWLNWDYKNGAHGSEFQQLSLGAEWLGPRWQFYGSGYLPLSRDGERLSSHSRQQRVDQVQMHEGQLQLARQRWLHQGSRYREALRGFDLEAGYTIPLAQPDWQWQLSAGALYRDGRETGGYSGGWLGSRFTASELPGLPGGSRLGLELQGRYDQQNDDNWLAAVTLSIPFGGGVAPDATGFSEMLAPVRRQRGLATADYVNNQQPVLQSAQYEGLQLADGSDSLVGRSAAMAGRGDDLQDVINSGADLVLVSGTHQLDSALQLANDGQLLLGGGTALKGVQSGQQIVVGQPARLEGALAGQPVVEITADNVEIRNLALVNASDRLASTGVMVSEADGVRLSGLNIRTASNTGFGVVQYGGSGLLTDTAITTTGRAAHGVFAMAGGQLAVEGFYHFDGEGESAEDGEVSLTGTVLADYTDADGDRVEGELAQNIDDYQPTQAGFVTAGTVIDDIALPTDAVILGGGALTGETLINVARGLNMGDNVKTLVLTGIEGSADDQLNIELGRAVHNAGMSTYLISDGQIASGAVDLFMAGVSRSAGDGVDARIGVHSWGSFDSDDPTGADLPRDHPAHQPMLNYFADIDVDPDFYWFTLEAAPFDSIHWMTPGEIQRWGVLSVR